MEPIDVISYSQIKYISMQEKWPFEELQVWNAAQEFMDSVYSMSQDPLSALGFRLMTYGCC